MENTVQALELEACMSYTTEYRSGEKLGDAVARIREKRTKGAVE